MRQPLMLNSMIFPFSFKTLRRKCGGDLAVLRARKRGHARDDSVISVRSDRYCEAIWGADSGRQTAFPPLALWIRSSIASCWRSSSALAAGTASVMPGRAQRGAASAVDCALRAPRCRSCRAPARSARRSSRGTRRPGCRRRATRRAARAWCCRRCSACTAHRGCCAARDAGCAPARACRAPCTALATVRASPAGARAPRRGSRRRRARCG